MHRNRFGAAVVLLAATSALAQSTNWVETGAAGRLLYGADDTGDRIGNFSRAGYLGGDAALPVTADLGLPVITVNPAANNGDSLALIQAAINQASSTANYPTKANGYRAIVQLSPGLFRISNSINITNNSGIILRGAGSGSNVASNTTLGYTGTSQIDMIHVDSTATRSTVANSTHNVAAKVVPAGSYALPMDSLTGYSVGDTILVHRPSPQNWIHDIKMDQIPPRSDGGEIVQWTAGSKDQDFERKIIAIDQTTKSIMLDSPLPNALQSKYGGGTVSKITWNRANHIGIENLRGDGQLVPTTATDEDHADSFITIQDTENAWVRNVAAVHQVFAGVQASSGSKYITVTDASYSAPVSEITGGRRYSFNEEGQYALMQNLTSDQARHDFVNNSPSRGPNVFLNGVATNSHAESGPHQRWSTGTLFDSITTNFELDAYDRGNFGTGHGWSGAQMVIWNSKAGAFELTSPPTAQNWILGSAGSMVPAGSYTPGYGDSANNAITLNVNGSNYTSLYQAQLADRLAHANETLREYTVGDYDSYAAGDTADAPFIDADWRAAVIGQSSRTLLTLDAAANNNSIPLTFRYDLNPATQHVTSAVLTLAIRSNGAAANDALYVETLSRSLSLAALPGFSSFTTETGFSSTIVTFEFLPGGTNFNLADLQDGKLNLMLAGNKTLDWANLVITVAPGAVPEPAALSSLLLTPLLRRTRRD